MGKPASFQEVSSVQGQCGRPECVWRSVGADFVRPNWRSYCGQLPLVTLVPQMAHKSLPVQAENVASLGTAHTHTTPAQPKESMSSIRYHRITRKGLNISSFDVLWIFSPVSKSFVLFFSPFSVLFFPFLLGNKTLNNIGSQSNCMSLKHWGT